MGKKKAARPSLGVEALTKGVKSTGNNSGFTLVLAQPDGHVSIFMSELGLFILIGTYTEEKAIELLADFDRCIALSVVSHDVFSGIYARKTDTKNMTKKLEQEVILMEAIEKLRQRKLEVV